MPKLNTPSQLTPPVENVVRKGIRERHHRIVPMLTEHEGQELYLPMVLLNGKEEEKVEVNAYADTLASFKGKSPKSDEPSNWDKVLEANRAYWIIFLATRKPQDLTEKWFLEVGQVKEEYGWDEAGVLMNDYLTIRMTQPHLTNLNNDDPNSFQVALDTIKKLGADGDFFLNGFTTHAVNQLLKYLAATHPILQKDNGSSGTP